MTSIEKNSLSLFVELARDVLDRDLGEVTLDSELTGLGLDSIDRLELLGEIEAHLGRKVDDVEALQVRTVGDLIALLTGPAARAA